MEKTSSKREDPEKIEETIITTPTIRWEDLPHHLLELFLKPISEPIDRPNLSRVCKAWQEFKTPPRSCFPALVDGPTICKFIKGGRVDDECRRLVNSASRICFGSSHGWLFIRIRRDHSINNNDSEYHRYYLLNIHTKDTILLPILRKYTVMPHICLSSPPTDPDCIAVLFDITFQGFLFSKRGWNKWIKSDCKYPIYSKPAEKDSIYYVFLFQRKFYACTIRGNIVAIDINVSSSAILDRNSRASAPPMTSLTVLPVDRIVPSNEEGCQPIDCSWSFSPTLGYTQVCHDWFLIESLGKLLAVRLYRREKHKEIVNLDVLELDFKTMSWIKVKNLPGDQVLFISLFSSFSISASEIGIGSSTGGGGGNCIYVSDHTLGKIHKYDMHNQEMMVCTGYGYPPTVDKYRRLWVKPTFL